MTKWNEISDCFKKIKETYSIKNKKYILSQYNFYDMRIFLTLVYDPYIKYNITKVEKQLTNDLIFDETFNINNLIDGLDLLSERTISGNAAIEYVTRLYYRLPVIIRPYLECILQKDLRIGIGVGIINSVFKDLIPQFELALCERFNKFKPKDFKFPLLVEPKIDGLRALVFDGDELEIKARSGIKYENYQHIEKAFKDLNLSFYKMVFDGEIVKGNDFQNTMTNARRKHNIKPGDEVYKIWDILTINEFIKKDCVNELYFRKRSLLNFLCDYVQNSDDYDIKVPILDANNDWVYKKFKYKDSKLQVIPWDIAYNMTDIIKAFEKYKFQDGEEGVIFKDPYSMYIYSAGTKRGKAWGKFKIQNYKGDNTLDITAEIMSYYPGTVKKKYENILGGFKCMTIHPKDNKEILFNIGGGYKDDQRQEFWNKRDSMIGMIVDIKGQEITKDKQGNYSIRFPIFDKLRPELSTVDVGIQGNN